MVDNYDDWPSPIYTARWVIHFFGPQPMAISSTTSGKRRVRWICLSLLQATGTGKFFIDNAPQCPPEVPSDFNVNN